MKKKINTVLACAAALAFTLPASADDGYIQSDGTTFINLGHLVGPKTKIELDFQMTEVANGIRMMGSIGDANNPRCRFYVGSISGGGLRFSFTTSESTGVEKGANLKDAVADTERHTMIMDYSATASQFKILTDGTLTDSATFASFPSNVSKYPIGLFAENRTTCGGLSSAPSSSTFYQPVKMKVYGLTICEDGEEVKKFVPCVKGGCAGLYETHSGLFHQGETYDAIAAGGDVMTIKDDPYIWSPRNVLGGSAEKNMFIDTGYTVKANTRIELDYAMMTNYVAGWTDGQCPYLISSQTKNQNNSTLNFSFYAVHPGRMACHIGFRVVTNAVFDILEAHNVRRTVSMCGDGNLAVMTAGYTNLTWKSDNAFNPEHTFSEQRTLKIGSNLAGDGRYLPMKIYGFKIFESDSLIKDYVPFVENGVVGLVNTFDVSDKLHSSAYSTAKGMAVADAGGDVTDTVGGAPEAYLEFDGIAGHGINTGYTVTKDTCIEIDMDLWSSGYSTQQFFFEQRGYNQDKEKCNGIWSRLYTNGKYAYSFRDYSFNGANHGNFTSTGVDAVPNARRQFKFDGYTGKVSVMAGDTVLYNNNGADMPGTRTAMTCTTNLWIGASWSGGGNPACMRLYNFKISEAGMLQHNYVPCVQNGQAGLYDLRTGAFKPLPGGKVSGATLKGEAFQIAPEPAKLAHSAGSDSATLTCLAAGAQSYEWYEDGVLIEGAVSDALTLTWTNKTPHTRTYSVVPVYTVFNETVKGDAVGVTVEYTPLGTVICVN